MRRTLLALLAGLVLIPALAAAADFPIDLNSASLEEIMELPLPPEEAQAIYEYREFQAYFKSVYDLMKVPGIDAIDLETLKPLVRTEPVEEDLFTQRMNVAQRNVRRWGKSEGSNEGLIDLWIDLAKDPPNINTASMFQLQNLQNVSPVDAVAIYEHRKAIGSYRSRRDLRFTPNLSGWGYMNARSLVKYEETAQKGDFHGAYQMRMKSQFFDSRIKELLQDDVFSSPNVYDSWWDRLKLDASRPEVLNKVFLKYYPTNDVIVRGGAIAWRLSGEEKLADRYKGFAGIEGLKLGPVNLDKVYVGNYLVAFGQGLVMENSDYFKSRKSGYSFDKRYYGIVGDISRTDHFRLSGGAVQASWDKWSAIGFYSNDNKDVVVNDDGSAAGHIILTPSIDSEVLDEYRLSHVPEGDNRRAGIAIDGLHEQTYGGNLRYVVQPGSHVGFSGYESRYNRRFDPQGGTAFIDRYDRVVNADNEIFNSYKSPGKFRRVYGLEGQSVFKNFCVQAEYAEMDINGSFLKLGDDPNALIASVWSQYNNLSFLALYRNYSLGFDNPYCRGFSNYERYKGTILEDQYYLTDPIYGYMFQNAITPQAERGVFLSTRFRITQALIPRIEYDRWTRVADGASYSRFVGNLEIRLLYPLRLKIRQQFQGRNADDNLTPTSFDLNETRVEMELRLSNYDMIEFMYLRGGTSWPPRPRLVGSVEPNGDHPAVGQAFQPARALLLHVIHNFTDRFTMAIGALTYDGFLWYFEESDFVAIDKSDSYRFWISLEDRITDRLWIELKAAYDRGLPITNTDVRQYNQPIGETIDADPIVRDDKHFRLQIDYMW